MTTRQNLLCRLLDPGDPPLPAPSVFEEAVDPIDRPLAAMCLARQGELKRFERLLPTVALADVPLISRYCALLGLADDAKAAMLLFDALRRWHRQSPVIWLDLAIVQAAWGFEVQSLRSIGLYNALMGRAAVGHLPAFTIAPVEDGGPVHFLAGDESRFNAV